MDIAAEGLILQKVVEDDYGVDAWDLENGFRCFGHLTTSEQYQLITGQQPVSPPANAEDYTNAGLPWFDLR